MARRVILSDDFTGEESDDVMTSVFMLAGKYFEIDLNDKSRDKLEKALKQFMEKGREISDSRAKILGAGQTTVTGDSDANAIREWAKANNKEVSERGRISQELREEYHKAMANANNPLATNDGPKDNENDGENATMSETPAT